MWVSGPGFLPACSLRAVNPDGQSFDGGFLGFRTLFSYFGGQFLGVA